MKRVNLLDDYQRILRAEGAPRRTALAVSLVALLLCAAYFVVATRYLQAAKEVIAQRDDLQLSTDAMTGRIALLEEESGVLAARLEDERKAVAGGRDLLVRQRSLVTGPAVRLAPATVALATVLPADARLVSVKYDGTRLLVEGFGLTPPGVAQLVRELSRRGVPAELQGLSTRRRREEQTLYFHIALRLPAAGPQPEAGS